MPIVYVSQLPHKLDPLTGTYVPAYKIDPAYEHGTVQILVPPRAPFTHASQLVPQLGALANYNFTAGDCLLLLGDPVVIATIVALVALKGEFRVLRWDRNMGRYVPIIITTAAH